MNLGSFVLDFFYLLYNGANNLFNIFSFKLSDAVESGSFGSVVLTALNNVFNFDLANMSLGILFTSTSLAVLIVYKIFK